MKNLQKIILGTVAVIGVQSLSVMQPAFASPLFPGKIMTAEFGGQDKAVLQNVRFNHQQLRNSLENKGFSDIVILDRRLFSSTVEACKNNNKLWLKVSNWGRIKRRRHLGSCRRDNQSNVDISYGSEHEGRLVKPRQVRRILRRKGFRQIRFTDRQLPVYQATACKRNRKINLRINRRGRIIDRNYIGRCNGQNDGGRNDEYTETRERPTLPQIRKLLRKKGYRKIHYTDRSLPRYVATACRRGAKFRLAMNRWGEIRRRNRIGWCQVARQDSGQQYDSPRVYYDDEEISGSYRLSADQCQNQLEYLVDRKKIYFDIGSSRIKRGSYRLLRKLAHVMKRCSTANIEIAGHTDSVGSAASNHELSHRRAHSVTRELIDLGIRRSRLNPKGYGEHHPIASNETNRGKAKNRRIDFIVSWEEEDYMAQR